MFVLFIGWTNSAEDVFIINVLPESFAFPKQFLLKSSETTPSVIHCHPLEQFTTMSITLDANFLQMNSTIRVDLARKMKETFEISEVGDHAFVIYP